jgi:cytochrome c553
VKRLVQACLLSYPLLLPVVAAANGDAVAGKLKAEDGRCLECHDSGPQQPGHGFSNGPEGKFAKLAGQYPGYIEKQVKDFRSGGRRHDFMAMIANSVDDADLADIAAYFSSQTPIRGDGTGDNPAGRTLFINGDSTRNIVPCISCHGAGGKGLSTASASYPMIGGQGRLYLEKQLIDWRGGDRRNDQSGAMSTVTSALTDAEIQALANYISGL